MIHNNDKSKDDLNPKCEKIKQIPGSNNGLPVCLISDFEGRPDLLILFLIQSGVIVDQDFKTECLNFITPEHQPKDYYNEDFTKLNELVVKLLTMFQTKQGIDTDNATLQFLGDYFGNRSLAGKKDKDNKEIVKVGSIKDKLPKGKHLFVNNKQCDDEYGSRSNIILCGTAAENIENCNRTIELNKYVSNIMLKLIELKNVAHYVAGNHDVYGSNLNYLSTGSKIDRIVFHATDSTEDPCIGWIDKYQSGQTYDNLDCIKNEFINGLKTKNKPLQLFNYKKIGDKNFIFKHTNFATEGSLWEMSKLRRQKQEVEFLPNSKIQATRYEGEPIGNLVIKKEKELKIELSGDKGAKSEDRDKYNFKDITKMNIEDEYNCFVCFGHTGQASENGNLTKNNCLCVDCNFYTQDDKDKCEKQCNFFRISADGNKIEEINLYTGDKIREFNTFQKNKAREQEKQKQENKIEEERAKMKKQINDLKNDNASLRGAVDQMNAQLAESNNKAQEEQNKTRAKYQKVEKIRNYIEYNTEIEAETIDADSITEYLNNKGAFKNRGNSITRNIGFDRRRKARFNALCEVLEEKIREKTEDNTFTFGDDFNNINNNDDKMQKIKELFQENGNNQHNEANDVIIHNARNNLNNTQTINRIKEDIANRLNQVGCCC